MSLQQIKVAIASHGRIKPTKLVLERLLQKLREVIQVNDIKWQIGNEDENTATVAVVFEAGEKIPAEIPRLYEFIAEQAGVSAKQMRELRLKGHRLVFARDILTFIIVHRYGFSTWQTAKIIGAKSHASTILSCRKFNTEDLNPQLYKSNAWIEIYQNAKSRYYEKN